MSKKQRPAEDQPRHTIDLEDDLLALAQTWLRVYPIRSQLFVDEVLALVKRRERVSPTSQTILNTLKGNDDGYQGKQADGIEEDHAPDGSERAAALGQRRAESDSAGEDRARGGEAGAPADRGSSTGNALGSGGPSPTVPGRLDRERLCGNACTPQQAETIGRVAMWATLFTRKTGGDAP